MESLKIFAYITSMYFALCCIVNIIVEATGHSHEKCWKMLRKIMELLLFIMCAGTIRWILVL